MFQQVATSIVFVSDQDKAKDFYVNKLGFVLRSDAPMYPGAPSRWLTVATTETAVTEILLDIPRPDIAYQHDMIGKPTTLLINVKDMPKLIEELKAKGVRFDGEMSVNPWGNFITMLDQDDNQIGLTEPF